MNKKEKKERKPNWREYTATIEDIQHFIEDRMLLRYNVVRGRAGEFMSVARALQIVGGNLTQKLTHASLGRAFTELGFIKKILSHVRGYVVVQRTPEEIKARQRLMAVVSDGTDVF